MRWFFVYGIASLTGLAAILNRIPWQIPAGFALVTLGLSFYYVWIVTSQGLHYFEDEVGREMAGLVLICLYMIFLVFRIRVRRGYCSF